jgi:AraC family transcriptional regulator
MEHTMLPPIFSTSSYPAGDFTFEHYRQPAFALLPQAFLMCSILIKLDGPSNVEINCGEKLTRRQLSRGDVIIIPDRFSIEGAHVEACEFLQLCLNPSVVERSAKELGLGDHVKLAPVLGVVDPLAEQTIYQLEQELTSAPLNNGYIKVLVDTLAKHLVRYYTEGTWTRNQVGGFPQYLLDRILEYVENNRDRSLSPQEIAGAVGVDPDRFAEAFKAATGKSIQTYLNK